MVATPLPAADALAPDTTVIAPLAPNDVNIDAEVSGFTAPISSWGEGDGLSGDLYSPSDVDSLIRILEKIEFKAVIDADDYIQNSNINAEIKYFNEGSTGSYTFSTHANAHNGDDWNGSSITSLDNSTVVEYAEEFKNPWGRQNFVRGLNQALQNDQSDSGYIFINPQNFSASGIISGNGSEINRGNPNSGNDFDYFAENSAFSIEVDPELAFEIAELTSNGPVDFNSSNISSFTTDNGDQGDIIIKVADYVDEDGVDTVALNSDLRLTLNVDNDLADNLTKYDNGWAYIRLETDNPNTDGHSNSIHVNASDHDSYSEDDMDSGDVDVRDFVESNDDGTSSIEFVLHPWTIKDAANALGDGETLVKFSVHHLHVNFETLSGSSNVDLHGDQFEQLTNSIQSITFDFTGYLPDVVRSEDVSLSANPLVDVIDIAKLSSDSPADGILDFEFEGMSYADFYAEYDLFDISQNNNRVGDFRIGAYYDSEDEYEDRHANGSIYNNVDDFNNLKAYLNRLSLNGQIEGGDFGDVHLEFDYDSASDSVNLRRTGGYGWGGEFESEDGTGSLPDFVGLNWQKFADLEIINFEAGMLPQDVDVFISSYLGDGSDPTPEPPGDASISLNYNLYHQFDYQIDEPGSGISPLNQLAVLGDSVDSNSRFILDIDAESLVDDYYIESADIEIKFDPALFGNINASDIKIGGSLPLANAVHIDNETGTIRLAASSLSDLSQGSGIYGKEALASIALNFDEDQIQYLEKNADGSLKISPLAFDISVNEQETIFSNDFADESGLLNREIVSLDELGGSAAISGQEVTLYEAKINLEQQGDGLVLGTERVIGADASYTNLVRKGDTLTASTEWLNVGNIRANNLSFSEIANENATIDAETASFSEISIASGSFVEGDFVEDARESTIFTADINITGDAGNVVDLSDGIVAVHADGTSEVFTNEGKGSSNLITFQGDLNYDGRVSMKDLAYLNAGAARQVESTDGSIDAASVARDVDADFSGKIDLADLSVLDADWGKTLHTGDEQFQGSADVTWSELDSQGISSTWDNDSFKGQNAIEAESDYVGSLESPTSAGVIGADGNNTSNDNDITGSEFQDPIGA